MQNTWPTKQLGEIANCTDGDWILSKDLRTGRDVRLVQLGDIGEGLFLDKTDKWISQKRCNELKCTILKTGDILLARLGEPLAKACIFPVFEYPCITAVDVTIIRATPQIEPRFLLIYLNSEFFKKQVNEVSSGATRQRISRKNLENLPIPLPPIEIQKKIVENIEGLFAKIDEAACLNAESLSASVALLPSALHHIFSRAEKEGWEEKKLADICKKTKLTQPKEISKDNFRYIDITSVGDMDGNGIISARIMPVNDAPSRARKPVRTGDTIFATTRPYLKRIAFISQQLDGSVASTGFCVLRSKQEVADSSYVFHIVNSDNFVSKIVPLQRGASYPAVSDKDVLNQKIPLPPIPEQKKIVAHLDALSQKSRALKELQKLTADDLLALKQSILHQALGGGCCKIRLLIS